LTLAEAEAQTSALECLSKEARLCLASFSYARPISPRDPIQCRPDPHPATQEGPRHPERQAKHTREPGGREKGV